jgi:membrane protease subunit (stomatin/prohibitin family)
MPRGFGGGGFHGGGFRGGFGGRRFGMPMIGMGGMGMGMGSPLLTGLFGGGLGYLLGSRGQQQQQAPANRAEKEGSESASNSDDKRYAKLKQLGELHDSGVLSDAEFAREKNRILET